MRIAEIFGLKRTDLQYGEGVMTVRAKIKAGKIRYVPMPPELAREFKQFRTNGWGGAHLPTGTRRET
jgi:integrase